MRNGKTNIDSEDEESDAAAYSSSEDEKNDSESEEEFEWRDNEALDDPKRPVRRKSLFKNLPDHYSAMTAVQVWQLLVPTSVVAVIVEETNRYAQQNERKQNAIDPLNPNQRNRWTPLTVSELYCFFGLCVAMSIGPKGNYKTYWSNEIRGGYISPQFGRIMPRKRYEQIKSNLHFTNNDVLVPPGAPGYAKLGKLGTVLNGIVSTFPHYMQMGTNLNVDEGMIRSRHRSHLRQYLPKKPDKYGIKCWCLNCSDTGYFFAVIPYAGRRPGEQPTKNLATASVLQCIDAVGGLPLGAIVAMDRFFTSPLLFRELLDRGYDAVGTVMTNRRFYPADLIKVPKGEPRGTIKYATTSNGDMMALTWYDNKEVNMLTTKFDPTGVKVKRKAYDKLKTNHN